MDCMTTNRRDPQASNGATDRQGGWNRVCVLGSGSDGFLTGEETMLSCVSYKVDDGANGIAISLCGSVPSEQLDPTAIASQVARMKLAIEHFARLRALRELSQHPDTSKRSLSGLGAIVMYGLRAANLPTCISTAKANGP